MRTKNQAIEEIATAAQAFQEPEIRATDGNPDTPCAIAQSIKDGLDTLLSDIPENQPLSYVEFSRLAFYFVYYSQIIDCLPMQPHLPEMERARHLVRGTIATCLIKINSLMQENYE